MIINDGGSATPPHRRRQNQGRHVFSDAAESAAATPPTPDNVADEDRRRAAASGVDALTPSERTRYSESGVAAANAASPSPVSPGMMEGQVGPGDLSGYQPIAGGPTGPRMNLAQQAIGLVVGGNPNEGPRTVEVPSTPFKGSGLETLVTQYPRLARYALEEGLSKEEIGKVTNLALATEAAQKIMQADSVYRQEQILNTMSVPMADLTMDVLVWMNKEALPAVQGAAMESEDGFAMTAAKTAWQYGPGLLWTGLEAANEAAQHAFRAATYEEDAQLSFSDVPKYISPITQVIRNWQATAEGEYNNTLLDEARAEYGAVRVDMVLDYQRAAEEGGMDAVMQRYVEYAADPEKRQDALIVMNGILNGHFEDDSVHQMFLKVSSAANDEVGNMLIQPVPQQYQASGLSQTARTAGNVVIPFVVDPTFVGAKAFGAYKAARFGITRMSSQAGVDASFKSDAVQRFWNEFGRRWDEVDQLRRVKSTDAGVRARTTERQFSTFLTPEFQMELRRAGVKDAESARQYFRDMDTVTSMMIGSGDRQRAMKPFEALVLGQPARRGRQVYLPHMGYARREIQRASAGLLKLNPANPFGRDAARRSFGREGVADATTATAAMATPEGAARIAANESYDASRSIPGRVVDRVTGSRRLAESNPIDGDLAKKGNPLAGMDVDAVRRHGWGYRREATLGLRVSKALDRWSRAMARVPDGTAIRFDDARDADKVFRFMRAMGMSRYTAALMEDWWRFATPGQRRLMANGMVRTAGYAKGLHLVDPVNGPRIIEDMATGSRSGERYAVTWSVFDDPYDAASAYEAPSYIQWLPKVDPAEYAGDVAKVSTDFRVIGGGTGRRISEGIRTRQDNPRLVQSIEREIAKLTARKAKQARVLLTAEEGAVDVGRAQRRAAGWDKRIAELEEELALLRREPGRATAVINEARRVRRETGIVNPLADVERLEQALSDEYNAVTALHRSLALSEDNIAAREADIAEALTPPPSDAASTLPREVLGQDAGLPIRPGFPDPAFAPERVLGPRPAFEQHLQDTIRQMQGAGTWTGEGTVLPAALRQPGVMSRAEQKAFEDYGVIPLRLFEQQLAGKGTPFGLVNEDELYSFWRTGSFERVDEVYASGLNSQSFLTELRAAANSLPGAKSRPRKPQRLYTLDDEGTLVELTGQAKLDAIRNRDVVYNSKGEPTRPRREGTGSPSPRREQFKQYVPMPWASGAIGAMEDAQAVARSSFDSAVQAWDEAAEEVTARAQEWAQYAGRLRMEGGGDLFATARVGGGGDAVTWTGKRPPNIANIDSPMHEFDRYGLNESLSNLLVADGVLPADDAAAVVDEVVGDGARTMRQVLGDYEEAYVAGLRNNFGGDLPPAVEEIAREQARWTFARALTGQADMIVDGRSALLVRGGEGRWGQAAPNTGDLEVVGAREAARLARQERADAIGERLAFWQTRRDVALAKIEDRRKRIFETEQRIAKIKATPQYGALVKAKADGRLNEELANGAVGHITDPARWGNRQHALHLWQTSNTLTIPSFALVDKVAARHSYAGILLGRNRVVQKVTDWWVLATLFGPRYGVRNSFEDLGMYWLTGGKMRDLHTGRRQAQALREARGVKQRGAVESGPHAGEPIGKARRRGEGKLGFVKEQSRKIGDLTRGQRILGAIFHPHLDQAALVKAQAAKEAGDPEPMVELVAGLMARDTFSFLSADYRAGVSQQYLNDFIRFHKWDRYDEAAEADAFFASGTMPDELGQAGDLLANEFPSSVVQVRALGGYKDMRVDLDANPTAYRFWQQEVAGIADYDGPMGKALILGLRKEARSNGKWTEKDTIDDIARIIAEDTQWGYKERFSAFYEEGASIQEFASRYYVASSAIFRRSDRTVNATLVEKLLHKTDPDSDKPWDVISAFDPETGYLVWSKDELAKLPEFEHPYRVLGRDSSYVVATNDMSVLDRSWAALGRVMARMSREPIFMANYMDARKTLDGVQSAWAAEFGDEAAARMVSDLAYDRAFHVTMSYTDNPATRSVLAWNVRNVARFYRATEDFYRRMWRTTKNNPLALYKAALTYDVATTSGWMWTDEYGDEYFIYPGSQAMNQAVGYVLNLFGMKNYIPDMPMMFAGKTSMLSPSMDSESMLPSPSGPWSGFMMKSLMQVFPTMAAFERDLLGKYAVGKSLPEVVLPPSVFRTLALLGQDDRSLLYANAWKQAATIVVASGNAPRTPEEIETMQTRLDMTATALVGLKLVFGMFVPASPQVMDGSAAQAAMALGVKSLDPAYRSLLKAYGGDQERAIREWFSINPDKMPFTVPSTERGQNAALYQPLSGVATWHEQHIDIVGQYPVGATLFAPTDGEYRWATWSWLTRNGQRVPKDSEPYLRELLGSRGVVQYDEITQAGVEMRKQGVPAGEVDEIVKAARQALYVQYPGLSDYLNERRPTGDETLLRELEDIRGARDALLASGESGTRYDLVGVALALYDEARTQLAMNEGSTAAAREAKARIKNGVREAGLKLGAMDPQVQYLFNRYIFGLLNIDEE